MRSSKNTIVVKKIRKRIEGVSHAGMWKVAYADFVTAMMVLFLMLWIINNAPKETLNALGNYFEPTIFKEEKATRQEQTTLNKIEIESGESALAFNKLSSMIDSEANKSIKLEKKADTVIISIESSDDSPLFEKAKPELSPVAKQKLEYLSKMIAKLPYYITISSHTNGLEIPLGNLYNNWDLSLDRVNNVRKFFMNVGVSDDRIIYIVANSNSLPKYEDNPTSINNRRIDIALIVNDQLIGPSKKNLPMNVIN